MVGRGIPSRHDGAANLVVALPQAFCVAAARAVASKSWWPHHGGRTKAYDRNAVVALSSVSGRSDAL
jgi:hypothetical protein